MQRTDHSGSRTELERAEGFDGRGLPSFSIVVNGRKNGARISDIEISGWAENVGWRKEKTGRERKRRENTGKERRIRKEKGDE